MKLRDYSLVLVIFSFFKSLNKLLIKVLLLTKLAFLLAAILKSKLKLILLKNLEILNFFLLLIKIK